MPDIDKMKIQINDDKIIFDFRTNNDSNSINGTAKLVLEFVINSKKYPNYKELKIAYLK